MLCSELRRGSPAGCEEGESHVVYQLTCTNTTCQFNKIYNKFMEKTVEQIHYFTEKGSIHTHLSKIRIQRMKGQKKKWITMKCFTNRLTHRCFISRTTLVL